MKMRFSLDVKAPAGKNRVVFGISVDVTKTTGDNAE